MTMWNGKKKALTFSYDDAVSQDIRLIEIFGEVKRRIEELTAEFDQLLELDACGNETDRRFAEIAKEMVELKRQQECIASQLRNNQEAQERAHSIETALDQEDHHIHKWDEEMIRQLVHTVKVISADHIRVYLNDGTEIDQMVGP